MSFQMLLNLCTILHLLHLEKLYSKWKRENICLRSCFEDMNASTKLRCGVLYFSFFLGHLCYMFKCTAILKECCFIAGIHFHYTTSLTQL
jgi:hypothetical protein